MLPRSLSNTPRSEVPFLRVRAASCGILAAALLALAAPFPSGANDLVLGQTSFVYGTFDQSYLNSGPKLASQQIQGAGWIYTADLPENLVDFGIALNSTRVWVIGGFDGTAAVDRVWYATASPGSPALSSWTAGPDLPSPVRDHAVVVAERFLYVLGGRTGGSPRDSIQIGEFKFDGTLLGWRPSAVVLPLPLWNLRAFVSGGFLYIAGGCTGPGEDTATNAVYSCRIRQNGDLEPWQPCPSLPAARGAHSVAFSAGRIWILGGHDATGASQAGIYFSDVDPVSGALSPWQSGTDLPVALRDHATVTHNGILMILGGRVGSSVVRDVRTAKINADRSLGAWSTGSLLPVEVERHESFAIHGRFFGLGGRSMTGQYLRHTTCTTLSADPGQAYAYSGRFTSRVIDLGFSPTVSQIAWTRTGTGGAGFRWRMADEAGDWGSWTSPTATNSPALVGLSGRYFQYAIEFSSDGSQAIEVTQVTLTVQGLTFVSGTLTGAHTWTAANSPYVAPADVNLGSGCTLTIEPGVRAYFAWPAGLSMESSACINANGAEGDSIVFSALDGVRGHWKGVKYTGSSPCQLTYCVFEKAGEPWSGSPILQGNLICRGTTQPTLQHCVFRDGSSDGMLMSSSSVTADLCSAYGNASAGFRVTGRASSSFPRISACNVHGNEDGIVIEGSVEANPTTIQFTDAHHNLRDGLRGVNSSLCLYSNLLRDNGRYPIYLNAASWPANCWTGNGFGGNGEEKTALEGRHFSTDAEVTNLGIPYLVLGDISVYESGVPPIVRVFPGVRLEFASGAGLRIGSTASHGGRVLAVGTPSEPIWFGPAPGVTDWKGLYFSDGSDANGAVSLLEQCIVSGAGGSWGSGVSANVFCAGTTQPAIRECALVNPLQEGLHLASSTVLLESSRVDSCGTYPVYVDASSWIDLGSNSNTFQSNGEQAIALTGRDLTAADARWLDPGVPYRALGDIRVYAYGGRRTLTLDPGVTVQFASLAGLQIGSNANYGGQLQAIGTETNPIALVPAPGVTDWKGIYFPAGSDDHGSVSMLEHCRVSDAGGTWAGGVYANIFCSATTQPVLRNCVLAQAAQTGLHLANSTVLMDSTRVDSCGAYPVYVDAASWLQLGTNANTFSQNHEQAVALAGRTFAADVDLPDPGIAYRALGSLIVYQASGKPRLSIDPGVTLEFGAGTGLQVGGSPANSGGQLQASGTPELPIRFCPAPGVADWKGLYFAAGSSYDGGMSLLNHCSIQGAGGNWTTGIYANLYCSGTNQPTLQETSVLDGLHNGIYLSTAPITIQRCLVSGNGENGIVTTGAALTLGGDPQFCNRIEANGGYELRLGSNHNVDASNNWWGTAAESEIEAEIYHHADNATLGTVNYTPWSEEGCGDWPLPSNFHLLSPADGIRVLTLTPSLDWEDAAGPGMTYDLELATEPGFQGALVVPGIEVSQYAFPEPLADGQTWYWRVKATSSQGYFRYSTETWTVLTNVPPSVPELLYPRNSEPCASEWYLVWVEPTDQGGSNLTYRVQVDDDPAFTSPEIDESGIVGTRPERTDAVAVRLGDLNSDSTLVNLGLYYWRVEAYDFYPDGSGFSPEPLRFRYFSRAVDVAEESPARAGTFLGAATPNPSSGPIELRFGLDRTAEVDLAVYDVSGRHLRTLISGAQPAGRSRIDWDLRNEEGRLVESGAYWIRMRAAGVEQSQRVLILR